MKKFNAKFKLKKHITLEFLCKKKSEVVKNIRNKIGIEYLQIILLLLITIAVVKFMMCFNVVFHTKSFRRTKNILHLLKEYKNVTPLLLIQFCPDVERCL